MNFKAVLFDFDGTVYDSGEGICGGVRYAAEKMGFPMPDDATARKFVGPPLRESFKKYCGLDDRGAEEALATYRVFYRAKGLYLGKPYDGIEKLLRHISDSGSKAYVATLKPTEFTEAILKNCRLNGYFEDVVGATMDKNMDSKSKIIKKILDCGIASRDALMIGDTAYDIEGAHENGVRAVAVTYGYGSRDSLIAAKPDYYVDSVEDIYKYI